MTANTCHSISEEDDVDVTAHTVDEENTVIDHHHDATTNYTDLTPNINDLSHGNKQMLNNSEERLRLNILRLLINLKNNNATKTCIEVCSRDIINVLHEYKDLDVSCIFINLHAITIIYLYLDQCLF